MTTTQPAEPPVLKSQASDVSMEKKDYTTDDSSIDVAKEEQGVDVTVGLIAGHAEDQELDPMVSKKLRDKLDWHMLPLLFSLYLLQFIDKSTINQASILGLLPDAHLSTDDFNNLGTAFYGGYLVFVGPHAWMMQRFPIAKYIAVNIFLWSVFIGMQCLCKSYGPLFAIRFLLGASEGCVTGGIMTIMTMFYTRVESTQRLGWTFQCNGFAGIVAGFVAFGVAHTNPKNHPHQWQWFMIILAIFSLIVSILYFWFFPDNPATARFLTVEEKTDVVKRVRINQNGIEAKVWKRYQFIEALKDPKTWFFFFFAAIADLQGGLGIEYSIIIKGMGFDTLQTTLLGIPTGAAQIIAITTGAFLIRKFPNSRTILGAIGFVPAFVSCFILLFLNFNKKGALLFAIYFIQTNGMGFVMILSLCAICVSGHTKKMTVNAIFLVGYSLGQMLGPQFWKIQYRPRDTVPWIIQLVTYTSDIVIILLLRWYLITQNKKRDAEHAASGKEYEEFGYVEHVQPDGTTVKYKVPIQFLDITDMENKAFRYPL